MHVHAIGGLLKKCTYKSLKMHLDVCAALVMARILNISIIDLASSCINMQAGTLTAYRAAAESQTAN